jgi:hypothetical protein
MNVPFTFCNKQPKHQESLISLIDFEEQMPSCLTCPPTVEGGRSRAGVGRGRLAPRGSAPPCRDPRPNDACTAEGGFLPPRARPRAGGRFTAFTHAQFCALLLALCMGLHPRLGQHCPMLALQDDVLRCICAQLAASQLTKHIVFHTQEQWLVA